MSVNTQVNCIGSHSFQLTFSFETFTPSTLSLTREYLMMNSKFSHKNSFFTDRRSSAFFPVP